ncbi:hypothetical protein BGX34_007540, partial [Mortierella sp. NVP85]
MAPSNFPSGTFYIQSSISGYVLDIESGLFKDSMKAGARVELAQRKASGSGATTSAAEQQQWRFEEGYIVNARTVRAGTRLVQNVRKTGKDAAGQQWVTEGGTLALAGNTSFVVTIDGEATRDGTRIIIKEKEDYNEKQKWVYFGGENQRTSPQPSKAESVSTRPDNFPQSWFYIKSVASGLVIDIEHGFLTDPMKAGARAEMNHQKIDNGDGRHSLLELQLWRYESGFLINRRTGFVLDIQGGTLKLAARVYQWHRKAGKDARNQHWFFEHGYICNVYNSRLVLDIDGDGTKDGAKIAIGERKPAGQNADQQWVLEEVRFQWLTAPADEVVVPRTVTPPPANQVSKVIPTSGWFWIKSPNTGHVVDLEKGMLSDPMAPNTLANMHPQVTTVTDGDYSKIETQLWKYENYQLINRKSRLVLDVKQGVVRYGARIIQDVPKTGKVLDPSSHHQHWESVNGNLVVQTKQAFAIDIEGDGSKAGARLTLQRPKTSNNADQEWIYELASFDWLKLDHAPSAPAKPVVESKVVTLSKDDWFFIKSSNGLVFDLQAGWMTSPTDPSAYIHMKKQRSLDDAERHLLERQLWRYEDGYIINRKTGYVIDTYGTAVVGVKLIQSHRAHTDEDGRRNQLWNVADGHIQLLHNEELVVNAETTKEGSLVQLVEKKTIQSTTVTWTLELAQTSWLKGTGAVRSATYEEGSEVARVSVHTEFPSGKWFYIKSKASNLVLDVEHGFFRDHTKAGAFLELNGQKLHASDKRHALLELQLWRFEDGYIINRRTGMVLDAADNSLKSGTRLIQWTRKTEGNANQQWAVDNGFIHLKNNPNLVLDVDGDGTRDGARIAIGERKDKKNLDQRWSFESVNFTWLSRASSFKADGDAQLLKEFEASNLARVVEHRGAPVDCWFYLKSGISDLVLEIDHGRGVDHLKAGTFIQLAHQKLKAGKHSHALLELQLWRYQDGHFINRRSGLALAVDSIESNAKLVQAKLANNPNQRWVIEDGVIRLAAHKEFVLFLSYGRQGSPAFIRQVRQGELVQKWSFAEVHFSWLTLERIETEPLPGELDSVKETEITYLRKEKAQLRRLE